jgi:hypothetical protein
MRWKGVVGAMVVGVLVHGSARAACSKDADCKGDRICSDEGKCVAPGDDKPKPKAKPKAKEKEPTREEPKAKPKSRYADDDDDDKPVRRRTSGPDPNDEKFGIEAGIGAPYTIIGASFGWQWKWWYEAVFTVGYGSSSASGSTDTSSGIVNASARASEFTVMGRARFWLMHGNHAPIIEVGEGITSYTLSTTASGTFGDSLSYTRKGSPAFTFLGVGYGYRADSWFRFTATLGVLLPDASLGDSSVTSTGSFTDADRTSFKYAMDGATDGITKVQVYGELSVGALF